MTETALQKDDLRRDQFVIGLVGVAHFLSHFFQLALPPLFPLLRGEFGVDYAALGLAMTLFYGVSGACQAFAGILVDRLGAKRMLVAGTAIMGGSIALTGLVSSYWTLLPLAVLAGIGNSVFHPADLSILSLKVSRRRLGRAYGVHAFMGTLGYASAVAAMTAMAEAFGWRSAAIIAGLAGVAVAAVLWRSGELLATPAEARRRAGDTPPPAAIGYLQLLAMPTVMLAFLYFVVTAAAGIGIQNFGATATLQLHGVSLATAASTVTAYLLGSAAGILLGGSIADRTQRHDLTAVGGMIVAALLMVLAALGGFVLPVMVGLVGLSGFFVGITAPSRDMMIRAIIPPGATGKVFGFVYSGLDAGGTVSPVLFGWLLDHGMPSGIFLASATLLLVGVVTVLRFTGPRTAARAG